MEEQISRHEFDAVIKRLDAENDRQNRRIDILENLTRSVQTLAVNMESMVAEQKKQSERLGELEKRDGDKWRTLTRTALVALITALATAAVTITCSKLGIL